MTPPPRIDTLCTLGERTPAGHAPEASLDAQLPRAGVGDARVAHPDTALPASHRLLRVPAQPGARRGAGCGHPQQRPAAPPACMSYPLLQHAYSTKR